MNHLLPIYLKIFDFLLLDLSDLPLIKIPYIIYYYFINVFIFTLSVLPFEFSGNCGTKNNLVGII